MNQLQIISSTIKTEKVLLRNYHLSSEKYKVNPILQKQIIKEANNDYSLYLSLSLINSKESPFPLDLIVIFSFRIKFGNVKNDEQLINFLNTDTIKVGLPYMRTLITSLTEAALMKPLILPSINVLDFKDSNIIDNI